jgi:hypothetical protein
MSKLVIKVSVKDIPEKEGVPRGELLRKLEAKLYNRVRFYTPVKTGKLKRGWRVSRTGGTITLRNKIKYASFLDSGQTKAKDPTKGMMYERAIRDTVKYINNRYNMDIKKYLTLERITE